MLPRNVTNQLLTNQSTWAGAPHTVHLNGDDVSAVAYIIDSFINSVVLVFLLLCQFGALLESPFCKTLSSWRTHRVLRLAS